MGRVCMYGYELPFADGRRIGRSWRTAGRLPERLMSEPRANIPIPLVPSWWSPATGSALASTKKHRARTRKRPLLPFARRVATVEKFRHFR